MVDSISALNFNFDSGQVIAGGLSVIFVAFFAISIVLVYHWQKYGIHKTTVQAVMIIYFTISIILLYTITNAALELT